MCAYVEFKYNKNDVAYLRDAVSLASRSVYRVRVLKQIDGLMVPRYEVESIRTGSVFVVDEPELSYHPVAYRVTPAQQERWVSTKSGRLRGTV